jgi:hypothetical protein
VYAFLYILRLSFVIDGVRYFTLADDEMISMRYAENLAAGHGLVWNAGGPRVEGYTNFLWVMYMTVFHWLNVPRPTVSLCVQITGALLLLANLVYVRKLAWRISGGSAAAALTAVAFVGFYVPLDNWAFQGTEVSVLALIVTAGCWLALRALDSGRPSVLLYMLLGSATLVRPDLLVFAGVVIVALAILQPKSRMTHLLAGGAIVGAFVGAETAFRLLYFGDPLPNTYYLKVSGFPWLPRISRGVLVTSVFSMQIAPLLLLIWAGRILRGPGVEARLLVLVFLCQVIYSTAVGGDAWESWGGSNRFIAIAMPVFLVCAAAGLIRSWPHMARRALPPAVMLSVFIANYLAYSVATPGDVVGPVKSMFLWVKPSETDTLERLVRGAVALRDFTDDRAVVGVVWAGVIPYFSQRQAIDLLGRTDRRIAHEPMHVPDGIHRWTGFFPGHLKWDYAYSIAQLEPDVIQAPLWHLDHVQDEPTPYLRRDYEERFIVTPWYLRRNSSHVIRDGGSQRRPASPPR